MELPFYIYINGTFMHISPSVFRKMWFLPSVQNLSLLNCIISSQVIASARMPIAVLRTSSFNVLMLLSLI